MKHAHGAPLFAKKNSLYFLSINRNKKSISLNLKSKEAQEIAINLAKKSDILIENFTFGKMKQFGLDYDSIKKYKENIIYTTVNSYGNKGPMRSTPSFDFIVQSYTGVMNLTGGAETQPYKVGYPICDIMTGSHVYGAILAGLLYRNQTGKGQYINTSLLEANLFAMPTIVTNYLNAGIDLKRRGNDHPTISPYTVFKLSNSEYVSIGVATDLQFKKLWDILFEDETNSKVYLEFSTNKQRLAKREQVREILQNKILSFDSNGLFQLFEKNGIPYSKINSMKDLFNGDNKQINELEMVKELKTEDYQDLKYIRNPITFSEMQLDDLKSPPSFGKHTKEVLRTILGYDDNHIDYLYKQKIIF